MTHPVDLTDRELLTAIVYGDTFALYDDESFDEFLEPLVVRLERNGIDRRVFTGRRCLDAGCGGGRGSILMAEAGAREVVGIDLSERNVESSRARAERRGLANCTFQRASLLEIPFEDETFDIVWCNGVLHHTADPDKGLREITRVLKVGGSLWLYLYGSGGIYWYAVDWIRDQLRSVDLQDFVLLLRLMDVPVRRIAEWIDDWFVPYLRRYSADDVAKRLEELGYENPSRLRYGMAYDTSQRRLGASRSEAALMGEGDLRYFVRKAGQVKSDDAPLPDPPDGRGSPYVDAPEVTQFESSFAALATELSELESRFGRPVLAERIIVCRAVHTAVRGSLEEERAFSGEALDRRLGELADIVRRIGSSSAV